MAEKKGYEFNFEIGIVGEDEAARFSQIIKDQTKTVVDEGKKAAQALDKVIGHRPTESVKTRTRKSKTKDLADNLGEAGKQAKKASSKLDRFIFGLGKLRFGINVTQFAFQSFFGVLSVSRIAEFDRAMNLASVQMQGFDLSAEQAKERLDALVEGFGGKRHIVTEVIGTDDEAFFALLSSLDPEVIRRIAEDALEFKELLGGDPKAFFLAFAQGVEISQDKMIGRFDKIAELFKFAPEVMDILASGKMEDMFRYIEGLFDEAIITPAMESEKAVDDLKTSWDEFVQTVLQPVLLPLSTFMLEEVTSFFDTLESLFKPENNKELQMAAITLGSMLGGAIAGGVMGGPLGAGIGGILGFALGKKLADSMFGDLDKQDIANRTAEINAQLAEGAGRLSRPEVGALLGELKLLGERHEAIIAAEAFGESIGKALQTGMVNVLKGLGLVMVGVVVGAAADTLNAVIMIINDLIAGINKGSGLFGLPSIPSIPRVNAGYLNSIGSSGFFSGAETRDPGYHYYAQGGIVPGPIGAPQLAVVHGGEEVIRHSDRGSGGNIILMVDKRVLGQLNTESLARFSRLRAGLIPGTIGS